MHSPAASEGQSHLDSDNHVRCMKSWINSLRNIKNALNMVGKCVGKIKDPLKRNSMWKDGWKKGRGIKKGFL